MTHNRLSRDKNRPGPSAGGKPPSREPTPAEKEQMEQELVEKLPDEVAPAQEWGGRYESGRTIATGGEGTAEPREVPPWLQPPGDVYLRVGEGNVAVVYCSRCQVPIGRVQLVSESEPEHEAEIRRHQIHGEINVIANEHRPLCSAA